MIIITLFLFIFTLQTSLFMNISIFIIVIVCLTGIIIYLFYAYNKARGNTQQLNSEITVKQASLEMLSARLSESKDKEARLEDIITGLNGELSSTKIENGKLAERIRITDEEKEKIRIEAENRFKLLANEIFEDKTKKFKETSEARLSEILNPLKENIELFKKTITDNYTTEAKERYSLQERIKELIELNHTIGKEAKDLTQALKGNSKMQGDWGEMILENILEKSGLTRDQEFFIQTSTNEDGKTIRNEDGRLLRPDVIVKFPDGKILVIDSKVSLTAYVNYINCDNPELQEQYIKQHLSSIRSHISELRNKRYQDFVGGNTDFVMMFVPNEAAYITAMQHDSGLWQEAYDSRVVIISPTHLISVLKLIYQLWSHDKQTRNAINIAEESGRLYDKFVNFVNDMNRIEKGLNQTQNAFEDAMKKLANGTGNLITRAEKLKELGAKATKALPSEAKE